MVLNIKNNKKLEVYVDASYKNGIAGIGIITKTKNRIVEREYIYNNSVNSNQAELLAIVQGIKVAKRIEKNWENIVIYTDSLGLTKKYNGYINGVDVVWIPRDSNIAHNNSVKARDKDRDGVRVLYAMVLPSKRTEWDRMGIKKGSTDKKVMCRRERNVLSKRKKEVKNKVSLDKTVKGKVSNISPIKCDSSVSNLLKEITETTVDARYSIKSRRELKNKRVRDRRVRRKSKVY